MRRALFIWLYRRCPRILDAITIVRPETVVRCGEILDRSVELRSGVLVTQVGDLRGKIQQSMGNIETIISEKAFAHFKSYKMDQSWEARLLQSYK